MIRRLGGLAALLVLVLAVPAAHARAKPGAAAAPHTAIARLHDDWDAILRAHVRDERVDYLALARKDLGRLDRYLALLARVEADTLSAPDRAAYWLNLYNATVVRAVCARYREGWRPDADGFALFKAPMVKTPSGLMPLDALEHSVIRRRLLDPRVHAALCCAAVSCPPLRPRAYRGATVDSLLEVDMRSFVRDRTRNQFDKARRIATLSQLFEWYVGDFGGPAQLPAALAKFGGANTSGWTVKYAPYDWALNIVAPEPGPPARERQAR